MNRVNRKKSQLQNEHKDFFVHHSQTRTSDAVDNLAKKFENLNLRGAFIDDFLLTEGNLTMKKVALHPFARNDEDRLQKRLA